MKKRNNNPESKTTEDRASKAAEVKKTVRTKASAYNHLKSRWYQRIRKTFLALFILYASVPLLICLFPWILGHVIYSHSLKVPFFVNLSHPADLSLNHTINFYLTPEEGVTVGVWHTVPDVQWQKAHGKDLGWYKEALSDGVPVIIYLHGNIGNRALGHRVELMKVLSAAGLNVLTLDYRGYGESTGQPSEAGMTTDALYLYHWVKEHSGSSPVLLWGHSLGSGVVTNAALKLQEDGIHVDGVILEAPYTNIGEESVNHPFGMIYWQFPGFESLIRYALTLNNLVFPNDENLKRLQSPVLLLHAEDDNMVPFRMSQKLYQIAQEAQNKQVKLVAYSKSLGYSHNGIYMDPQLPEIVRQFIQSMKLQ